MSTDCPFCPPLEAAQVVRFEDELVRYLEDERHQGALRDAIWFGHADPVPERVRLAWRLAVDEWQGRQRVQMVVEAAQPGG